MKFLTITLFKTRRDKFRNNYVTFRSMVYVQPVVDKVGQAHIRWLVHVIRTEEKRYSRPGMGSKVSRS